MRIDHAVLALLALLSAGLCGFTLGCWTGQGELKGMTAVAVDDRRTVELALRALDRAWLSCATPFNQGVPQDDDRPRSIDLRR